jgi:hypothetical protein
VKRICLYGVMCAVGFMLGGCMGGGKTKPASDELMRLARDSAESEFRAGFFEGSVSQWQRALGRANVLGDGRAAAQCRYQMAVCYLAMGQLKIGRETLEKARLEALAAGDQSMAARVEAADARVMMSQGDAVGASVLARQAMARLKPGDNDRLRSDIHLILAESALETTNALPAVRQLLQEALSSRGKQDKDPSFRAVVARIEGRIWAVEGHHPKEAAEAFEMESEQWRMAGAHSERAGALIRAATQRTLAGDWLTGADHQFQGARIFAGSGRPEQAREAASLAVEWVTRGLDEMAMAVEDRAKWEALRILANQMKSGTDAKPAKQTTP